MKFLLHRLVLRFRGHQIETPVPLAPHVQKTYPQHQCLQDRTLLIRLHARRHRDSRGLLVGAFPSKVTARHCHEGEQKR